ncbi:DUF485 domain-containing protein [Pseudomonas putida]|uniref:DUF485 domain-containing protein n=1 Tax=Pseudomonas putida TaxID=303 RepID=A0A6I6XGM3_PSEPU|nr:DUF485 domain-containing protein [Pseudomonas putida]QHG64627.1 DUF485 domain-containing protein [Pseudomonas putida]
MNISSNAYASHCQRIFANPRFKVLVQSRSILTWRLSLLVLCAYFAFMGVAACWPGLLHSQLYQGSHLSWGIPVAVMLILSTWLLTGWYVYRANTHFDSLSASIVEEGQA